MRLLVLLLLIGCSASSRYKVGDCAVSKIDDSLRQIVEVRSSVYVYRILPESRLYVQRKQSFDRGTVPIDCGEE